MEERREEEKRDEKEDEKKWILEHKERRGLSSSLPICRGVTAMQFPSAFVVHSSSFSLRGKNNKT
jgi:hypothetical protein